MVCVCNSAQGRNWGGAIGAMAPPKDLKIGPHKHHWEFFIKEMKGLDQK